jgi:hypothetical protein
VDRSEHRGAPGNPVAPRFGCLSRPSTGYLFRVAFPCDDLDMVRADRRLIDLDIMHMAYTLG